MVTALAARWLLTVVFAAAGLGAALSRRGRADAAGRVPAGFCAVTCAALTAMTWQSEPAAVAWVRAALFGCAALWPWPGNKARRPRNLNARPAANQGSCGS